MASSEDQLNWKDFLDPAHYKTPLHALRYSACKRLGLYLDKQDMCMHNDLVPNFGGLAELVGFDSLEIDNMERADSPTKVLFDEWKKRPELEPTVGRLMEFLARLGREDVLTDCHQMIAEEVKFFIEKPLQFDKMKSAPIQDQTVSQGPGFDEIPLHVTMQDVKNGCETYYDAFVCYNPYGESSKDLEFVKVLIKRFEGPQHKFKLFVPHRDDLAGLNAHGINAKIISERCRHMIVVLSKNFLESPACEFQSTFAHALSPGARSKRIIPIKIQECKIPNILRIMACCDFTKRDLWDWSWDRLARSIMVPLSSEDYQVQGFPSLDGLRTSNFDLTDSGISSITDSPTSSRSTSPASRERKTVAIMDRDPHSRQPKLMDTSQSPNKTVQLTPQKPKLMDTSQSPNKTVQLTPQKTKPPSSSSSAFQGFINKLSRSKGNSPVPDS